MTLDQVKKYLNANAMVPNIANIPYINLYYKLLQQSEDQKRLNRKLKKT